MFEKLLNLNEVAEYLGISEEAVRELVDAGHIPAYKIGGLHLRFRKDQIESVKDRLSELGFLHPHSSAPSRDHSAVVRETPLSLPKETRDSIVHGGEKSYSQIEKIKDFLYFNDFYIISTIVIVVLLSMIFKS